MRGGPTACWAGPRQGRAPQAKRMSIPTQERGSQKLPRSRIPLLDMVLFTTSIWAGFNSRTIFKFFQSKSIGELDSEGAAIPRQHVLAQEWGRRIIIMAVEQIVDAARNFQAFDEVLTEKSQIDHAKAGSLGPLES